MAAAEIEAQDGYKEFHNRSPELAWKFTILKARILSWRGMSDRALETLNGEAVGIPSVELGVQKKRLEAVAYLSTGKFGDADRSLAEAERECALARYDVCGDLPSARGSFEMARGHYLEAQGLFETALASARAKSDPFLEATALLNLSFSADEQTRFDEALTRADAARQISVSQHFDDITQNAIGNMGWAYYKLGDREKARQMLSEAEKQAETLGDTSDQIAWIANAGYTYMDDDNFQVAEESFRQSLDLARKIKSREDIVNALISLAFVSEQTNQLDEAKRAAGEVVSMAREDGQKRDEAYGRLVQGRVAAKEHDAAAAEAAFHLVAESADSPVFLKWEAEWSLAHLYEDENQMKAAGGEYLTALGTFEAARSELQHEDTRLPFLTNASGIYDDYLRFLVTHGKTDEALQVAEYQRGRTLAEGLGVLKSDASRKPSTSGAAFSNKLRAREMGHAAESAQAGSAFKPDAIDPRPIARRAGGTIFFYSLGEKQSYLWAITGQKIGFFPLPPKPEIDLTVRRYRKELADQMESLPQAEADGRELYRKLVAPAQAFLAQGKDARIFIIPDGSLNTLNFETLRLDEEKSPGHYWIEDATIADASSLHMLSAASDRCGAAHARTGGDCVQSRPSSLLLLGNAVSASADYPELQKASAEMEGIEKHFGGNQQRVFAREQATPAAYLTSKPEQFSYIHFVAHGTASRVSPLDSAIVLSPGSAQDDSFKLYARDIIAHPRLRADLVTISTCYGAGSRAYSGEGLVGLSWAFLRSGAHNVIGALWEVSDISTPQLMNELYDGLKQGKPPDAALRAAKLSLLHSKSVFSKPFYWAPFQLYTGS
jgi:CHAT domain-containing protein/tetratricopeptide (TPR) repeat protein